MRLKGYIKNGNVMQQVCVSDSIPVGIMIPFPSNGNIPTGFLICNGASVLRATYPDLFAAIGTTWGAEDELHFNLPDARKAFPEGASVAGAYKQAGLPNITGTGKGVGNISNGVNISYTGAFVGETNATTSTIGGYNGAGSYPYTFDASRSNPIYGRSDTVQPQSFTVRWIIKAFHGANEETTDVQITQLANELNEFKTQNAYIVDSGKSTDGTIWYRKWSDGWLEQGGNGQLSDKEYSGTINLPKTFLNADYVVTMSGNTTADRPICFSVRVSETNNFIFSGAGGNGSGSQTTAAAQNCYYMWYACGMGANE